MSACHTRQEIQKPNESGFQDCETHMAKGLLKTSSEEKSPGMKQSMKSFGLCLCASSSCRKMTLNNYTIFHITYWK